MRPRPIKVNLPVPSLYAAIAIDMEHCEDADLSQPAAKRPKILKEESPPALSISEQLLAIEKAMCEELEQIQFSAPVTHVYNPLEYAAETHRCYISRYGNSRKRVLFMGMNPGPFGMAQNGVPFGDVKFARDWLKISGHVGKPPREHPKRIIHGLDCPRSEVSGTRFWGLMESLCGTPEVFFRNCFVHNYCPLCFMAASGKNVTPPEMRARERGRMQEICDRSLLETVRLLEVERIVAVGRYPEVRVRAALRGWSGAGEVKVSRVTHPSPINPAANKGWREVATAQLSELGLLEVVKGTV